MIPWLGVEEEGMRMRMEYLHQDAVAGMQNFMT